MSECQGQMAINYGDIHFVWLCARCGAATWGPGCAVYVPAWAKGYVTMRKAAQAVADARLALADAEDRDDQEWYLEPFHERLRAAILGLRDALAPDADGRGST